MSEKKKKTWVTPEISTLPLPAADALGIMGLCLSGESAAGGPTTCESGTGAALTCSTGSSYGNYCGVGGNF